jgi:hypothetical protein
LIPSRLLLLPYGLVIRSDNSSDVYRLTQVESVLYGTRLIYWRFVEANEAIEGIYVVLFLICVYILIHNRRRTGNSANKTLIIATVAMFTMSTVHIAVDLVRGLAAFIKAQNIDNGAMKYYAQIWLPISIFKQGIYMTNK